jgi:hypothetical protein
LDVRHACIFVGTVLCEEAGEEEKKETRTKFGAG